MSDYSKITTVEVRNFMCFSHAKIAFDEGNNIINLKGYNDSGKSAMLKAIAVCLMDMFTRDQAKLIKHEEDYFRIIVSFDDGVSILRDKYINGQSLYEMSRDGKIVFSTKVGNKLTRVDGVPEIIEKYLGLCILDNGCLNYQSRDDRLWLIETKGSENYYSLNTILKTEELARANALLNSDKNALGSDISEIEAEIHAVDVALDNISAVSEEFVLFLSEKEEAVRKIYTKSEECVKIVDVVKRLSDLEPIPYVEKVEGIERLSDIDELSDVVSSLEGLRVYPEVERVDISRLSEISAIKDKVAKLVQLEKKRVPVGVESIDTERLRYIMNIYSVCKNLGKYIKALSDIETKNDATVHTLNMAVEAAKKKGIRFIKCDNCGTYMKVGTE